MSFVWLILRMCNFAKHYLKKCINVCCLKPDCIHLEVMCIVESFCCVLSHITSFHEHIKNMASGDNQKKIIFLGNHGSALLAELNR